MGVRERREREKSETRDKILDAARELFVTEGYEGVSMRKVAEKIEYSPTAIYVYFADKNELFRELCHQDYARLADIFRSSAMSTDPIERIRQIGTIYAEFGTRYPNHYRFMFMTPHPAHEFDEEDRELHGNPEKDAYAFLKWAVQQAIDAGCFREDLRDAEIVSQTLWAAVHGVISLQIAKCNDPWVEWRPMHERAAMMVDVALRGLMKPGPPFAQDAKDGAPGSVPAEEK
jgi:AcrR family transcriptional regulator